MSGDGRSTYLRNAIAIDRGGGEEGGRGGLAMMCPTKPFNSISVLNRSINFSSSTIDSTTYLLLLFRN